MSENVSNLISEQLRSELLRATEALKEHVQDAEKFSVGLSWSKVQKVRKEEKNLVRHATDDLQKLQAKMAGCRQCPLGETRLNLVFGDGNPRADIVFVGEAPGADEDEQGLPFVGRAGQLLTRIIEAMRIKRKDVYICNILKCRPPQNRNPLPEEISACEPFLKEQLRIISPRVICALGSFAAKTLLKTEAPITVLRGRFHDYGGIRLMPTYHPAYLLRNPQAKKFVWEDVQVIMREMGL